jgi:hypothetical protein
LLNEPSEEFGEYPTKMEMGEALMRGCWMATPRQASLPGKVRRGGCPYETISNTEANILDSAA